MNKISKNSNSRFLIAKWIMLSLAILLNAFIIFYSCLNTEITQKWNARVTNIFAKLVNNVTEKDVEVTPLTNIEIGLSKSDTHKYNYIPGYAVDEIPLGSAKQVECTFFPENATDKGITYSVTPQGALTLNQSGSVLSVVGMKAGDCVLTATSNDGGYTSSISLKVIDMLAGK